MKALYGEIKKAYTKALSRKAEESAKDKFDLLQGSISSLLCILEAIKETGVNQIDWDSISKLASKSEKIVWEYTQSLEAVIQERKKASSSGSYFEDFGSERYHLRELMRNLDTLQSFAQSSEARLSNVPALLLVGDAGQGKTHLFCDVAERRVLSDLPTVLLLGGQFSNQEPWSQIIHRLGLSCKNKEELLGALEAAAQVRGTRALILIDALNEGDGRKLWNKDLAGMLTALSRYPRIGIAVSVRTSYEQVIIPEGLVPDRLVREIHQGFVYKVL